MYIFLVYNKTFSWLFTITVIDIDVDMSYPNLSFVISGIVWYLAGIVC